jgi:hypothetical protein
MINAYSEEKMSPSDIRVQALKVIDRATDPETGVNPFLNNLERLQADQGAAYTGGDQGARLQMQAADSENGGLPPPTAGDVPGEGDGDIDFMPWETSPGQESHRNVTVLPRGTVAEVVLPSSRIAYLQYLEPGPLCDFVRVLDGLFSARQGPEVLDHLAASGEAFITQCRWKSLCRRGSTTLMGERAIPEMGDLVVREAPTSKNPEDDVYRTPDGHYRKGFDVIENYPGVDLSKCPLSSCPSDALLLKRIDYGWTPSISHIRGWLREAETQSRLRESSSWAWEHVLGWWVQDKDGHSFARSGRLLWGDEVADVVDEALARIVEIFSDQIGRPPTGAEIRAGVIFSLRGADLTDEPSASSQVPYVSDKELWNVLDAVSFTG